MVQVLGGGQLVYLSAAARRALLGLDLMMLMRVLDGLTLRSARRADAVQVIVIELVRGAT